MYEFTDKIIEAINRRVQHEFATLRRTVLQFDEVFALQRAVNACYDAILREAKEDYLQCANDAYKAVTGRDSVFSLLWIEAFLSSRIDPVAKYVFTSEYDRKRARTFEAVVVTKNKDLSKELKQAMVNLSTQLKQFAEEVTDEATKQAYHDTGVLNVRWVSEQDERVCSECRKRNNRIYRLDKVPDKPHIRCRCYLLPADSKQPSFTS